MNTDGCGRAAIPILTYTYMSLKTISFHLHSPSLSRGPKMQTNTHIRWKTSFYLYAYTNTLSAPIFPSLLRAQQALSSFNVSSSIDPLLKTLPWVGIGQTQSHTGQFITEPQTLSLTVREGKRGGAGGEGGGREDETGREEDGRKVKGEKEKKICVGSQQHRVCTGLINPKYFSASLSLIARLFQSPPEAYGCTSPSTVQLC